MIYYHERQLLNAYEELFDESLLKWWITDSKNNKTFFYMIPNYNYTVRIVNLNKITK